MFGNFSTFEDIHLRDARTVNVPEHSLTHLGMLWVVMVVVYSIPMCGIFKNFAKNTAYVFCDTMWVMPW